MNMFKQIIKIVELMIDEDTDAVLESVSLVEDPAIRKNFMYFNSQDPIRFHFEDEEQRIVVGPAMIPDMRIPRMDEDTNEVYYVYFTKESISKAAELFLKQDRASKQNTDHKRNFTRDVYVMESWIKEDEEDKSSKYGYGALPVGTWFVKMRVLDDGIWEDIKEGKLNGFSVQGSFVMGPEQYEQAFARHKKKYNKVRERYKKLYQGLTKEEKLALDQILYMVEMDENDMFDTPEAAIKRSQELGLNGEIHSHYDKELGLLIYMPGSTMADYEKAKEEMEINVSDLPDYTKEGPTGPRPLSQTEFRNEQVVLKMASEIGVKFDFANANPNAGYSSSRTANPELYDLIASSSTKGRTLYRYTGPAAERDFCRQMIGFNRLYTYEQIKQMESQAVNAGFGEGGSNTYSIWKYHGGPNCKHYFQKFYATINANGDIALENKGPAPGLAGTETYDQPNRGYVNRRFSAESFVSVSPGESKDEYIGRCMSSLQGEFPDEDQRYAVCITEWEGSAQDIEFESYTDYPEGATNNAKRALEWKEKNGSDCGTPVGWTRARQLANREPISEETIARMAAFERHRQNSETPYSEGCGGIMWDAWGGDSGIRWAQTKLKEIREQRFSRNLNPIERGIVSRWLSDVRREYGLWSFAAVEDLKVGDAVSWKTADQNPRGRIREIVREGSKKVPGVDFEIKGTPEDPGYIIEIYTENAEGNWTPSGEFVGRKADSILKNVEL